jgi:hypothetical protein
MNSYSYSSKEFLIVENLKNLATDMTPEPFYMPLLMAQGNFSKLDGLIQTNLTIFEP